MRHTTRTKSLVRVAWFLFSVKVNYNGEGGGERAWLLFCSFILSSKHDDEFVFSMFIIISSYFMAALVTTRTTCNAFISNFPTFHDEKCRRRKRRSCTSSLIISISSIVVVAGNIMNYFFLHSFLPS